MTLFEVEVFKVFMLVLARFSGLIVSAPVLSSRNFPIHGKIGLAVLSAIILTPTLPALAEPLPSEPLSLAFYGAGEFLIGLMIGFVMTLGFAAIQVAGQLMDMQSGFGFINVFSPILETQFPIFGFFYFLLAVLYLLAINGHHMMIRALVFSFEKIPLGGFVARPALFWEVSRWGSAMFYDGFMIAAPVVAASVLAYLTMGILGRLVPQINLFVAGFPLTIAVGLLIVALSIGLYLEILDGMFIRTFRNMSVMIGAMS